MKPTALNHLHDEHQCLLGQAAQIEDQLNRIREGSRPDYVLLADRVRFIKDHYRAVHAPKDAVLIRKLLEGADSRHDIFTPFLNAHASAFVEHLGQLEAGLQAVLCERLVSRERLLRHGDSALHNLRQQIDTEESATFPWARGQLRETDWQHIGRAIHAASRDIPGDDCAAARELFSETGPGRPPGLPSAVS